MKCSYSIITATYNAEKFLERSIVSILGQSYPDFEWLIQDGGSKDGTLEILSRYRDRRIKLQSEPDTGVYDAWNKAVARATGDWALFLGGDDCLAAEDVLVSCHVHIRKLPPAITFAYGDLLLIQDGVPQFLIRRQLCSVYHSFLADMGLPFPATFIRLAALKNACFDSSYKIAGDYDLAARLISPDNIRHLPVNVTLMETGGLSTNPANANLLLEERCRVLSTRIRPKAAMLVDAILAHVRGS